MKVELMVEGKPVSKGSMRTMLANRKGGKKYPITIHNNQDGIARYAADIRVAWEDYWGSMASKDAEPEPKGVPILLTCIFVFQRPQSHYLPVNKKRKMPELRKDSPLFHTQDPDGDKLVRSVGDALTGLAYADDNQIVRGMYTKRWGDVNRTYIEVGRYDDGDD